MGKAVKLDYEFEKERFANLVRDAIGNNTIAKYSERCGVSWSTLTNYMNRYRDTPPAPKTIMKIADASEGRASANHLLSAAGYEPFKYIKTPTSESTSVIMQYLSEILRHSRYTENINYKPNIYDASFIVDMNTKACPFDKWIFKIIETKDINLTPEKDFRSYLGSLLFYIPQRSNIKVSIIVDNEELFNDIQKLSLEYDIYVTIILINPATPQIEKEEFFNTSAPILHPNYSMYNFSKHFLFK